MSKKNDLAPLLGVVQPPKTKKATMTNFLLFLSQIAWTPVFSVVLAVLAIIFSIFTGLEGLPTILSLSTASLSLAVLSINSKLG